jgi:hypothetical protein
MMKVRGAAPVFGMIEEDRHRPLEVPWQTSQLLDKGVEHCRAGAQLPFRFV